MSTLGARSRPPAVAGQFYPGRARELAGMIDVELESAQRRFSHALDSSDAPARPKAIIVPHAGYVYSGPIAASAYVRLLPWREAITRVVLLGPAHRVYVSSMAVSSADVWTTPLGDVPLDQANRELVLGMPGVIVDDAAHAPEHSLEVHVPFLQRVLGDGWRLLPIVVGAGAHREIADVLDAVWGGDETLIVISTDLSHYHDHATAQHLDQQTAAAILAGDPDAIAPTGACGAYPVRAMLTAADRHQLDIELVDLRTSGDTAGSQDRVVGYGAFVLTPHHGHRSVSPAGERVPDATTLDDPLIDDHLIDDDERATLLAVAEEAIRARLESRAPEATDPSRVTALLRRPGASFVTLREGERLLGCIGTLEPRSALIDDVADNAVGAAFRDPRMPALTPDEFATMSLHVSVLTPATPLAVGSLEELRATIRPDIDGLVIEAGRHRATYLPSVWEQLPERDDFLRQLWLKAGLRPDAWPRGLQVSRYRTIEFGDEGPRSPIRP